jgi:N-acetylmuramoyl-L-alanine amidase
MKKKLLCLAVVVLILSCATNPYRASEKLYQTQLKKYQKTIARTDIAPFKNGINSKWISTVNFNLRKPNFIIIHHTAQDSLAQTLKTFTLARTQVSAHYVIGNDGTVVQMLNDYLRAWHGGNAIWGKNTDINSASIGIELDNTGFNPFSEAQITSLTALLARLKKEYNIPTQNIIGHADIAPTRKTDPSAFFPWEKLAHLGFGLWPNTPLETAPENFNIEQGLQLIGYDTRNLSSAIKAFKLHYIQTEVDDKLDAKTKNTVYAVYKKLM